MSARPAAIRGPKDVGPAAWSAILPASPPAEPLETALTADWLIIGCGFAGLAAARRLSQRRPGARIVVLEATRVAEGPTGRNTGFMIDLPHKLTSEDYAGAAEADRRETAQNRAAIGFAAEAAEEYGLGAEAFDRCGKINAAAAEAGDRRNTAYARHLAGLHEPHERLDAAAMRALTGSDYYVGGLYTPGTAMLQPALYARGVADGLRRSGVTIHENSPVIALSRDGGSAWRARTPRGDVTAPSVILTVNGLVERFGYFKRRLVHIHLYGSMTRALAEAEVRTLGGAPRWGLTPSDPMGSTVRRISGLGGDRIVVRNGVSYDPDAEIDPAQLARKARAHDASFAARFPGLAGVEMAYRWSGRLCLSLNDAPAFGVVDAGVVAACCQNGLGAARGTFSGLCAADLAAGETTAHLEQMLAAEGPKPLPPWPLDAIGAAASLWWRERRAGAEI